MREGQEWDEAGYAGASIGVAGRWALLQLKLRSITSSRPPKRVAASWVPIRVTRGLHEASQRLSLTTSTTALPQHESLLNNYLPSSVQRKNRQGCNKWRRISTTDVRIALLLCLLACK
jgi:hypothetical protein